MDDLNKKNSLKIAREKAAGRRAAIKDATPAWLTSEDKLHMKRFSEVAKAMSGMNEGKYVVDHIVPINHPLICGLNIPHNMQIITEDQNKQKGNSLHINEIDGAVTYNQILMNQSIRVRGKFVKGLESPNPKGRPAGVEKAITNQFDQCILNEIYEEADGDAVKFQQLLLKNGKRLNLDITTSLKIARDLAAYQSPKKASIETKNESVTSYNIVFDQPQLEQADIKILEHIDDKPEK